MVSAELNRPIVGTGNVKSSLFNRLIIFAYVFSLPFQEDTGTIAGISVPGLIVLIGFFRIFIEGSANNFFKIIKHPIGVSMIVFIVMAFIIESLHPTPFYASIFRNANNYLGTFMLATLVRDESDFKILIGSYIFSAAYMGLLLFVFGWGTLNSTSASTFSAANTARDETLSQVPISQNPNYMSYTLGLGILSIILYSYFRVKLFSINNKLLPIGVLLLLVLSLLVTMSRTGIVSTLVTMFFLMFYFRQATVSRIVVILISLALIYTYAPQSAKTRLTVGNTEEVDEFGNLVQSDSRSNTLNEAYYEIGKNFLWGTGEGNLWMGAYKKTSKLTKYNEEKDTYMMTGTHNLIFQIILHMGIFGFVFFAIILYNVFKVMPSYKELNFTGAIVLSFNIAAVSLMFFDNIISNKEYSIAYSMAISYSMIKHRNSLVKHRKLSIV